MAFPYRLLWTWDHRMDWAGPRWGHTTCGCGDPYLKDERAFRDDYRTAVDGASRYGFNGIIVWGLLRDSHGGLAAAQEICSYGAEHGVRIIAGVGTSHYGGPYYDGDHPYNIATYLRAHPDRVALSATGAPEKRLCPSHPENQQWLRAGVQWLYANLRLGGINFEHGDFAVCHCRRCAQARSAFPVEDEDYFKDMVLSLNPPIEAALGCDPNTWISYGAYSGFSPESLAAFPSFVRHVPSQAVPEWTLTCMLEGTEEVGGGAIVRPKRSWDPALRPPGGRGIGLLHQGSFWFSGNEIPCIVPLIQEACRKASRSGLEGVVIEGEASPERIPAHLNYLALSFFSDQPEASLEDFAVASLADLCGGAEMAIEFVQILANSAPDYQVRKNAFDRVFKELWMKVNWDPRFRVAGTWRTRRAWEWLFHLTLERAAAAALYTGASEPTIPVQAK